jgi:hypothetical protein
LGELVCAGAVRHALHQAFNQQRDMTGVHRDGALV